MLLWSVIVLILVIRVFGLDFIPSPGQFLSGPTWVPGAFGVVVSIPVAIITSKNLWGFEIKSRMLSIICGIFTPYMTAFSAGACAEVGLPMIHAALEREPVQHDYRVIRKFGDSSSRDMCSHSVQVNVDVFGFSDVCNVPNELRRQLGPGVRLGVVGSGSDAGVYYSSFRLVKIAR